MTTKQNASLFSEGLLRDFSRKLTGEKKKKADEVHKYLKETYPPETLQWVHGADWKLNKEVPLSEVKMARRPGGAREKDKVKGIAQAVRDGEKMEPVVLVELPDGTKKIADGYHRTLGHQHANVKTVKAWVGKVNEKNGPWDKEMHEKKLNKGPMPKTASYELTKLAAPNVFGLAKRFAGGVTGVSKKKAQREFDHAKDLKNVSDEFKNSSDQLVEEVSKLKPKKPSDASSKWNGINSEQARVNDLSAQANQRFDNASYALSRAKKDQFVSRGIVGVGATGALAVNQYNQIQKQKQNQPQNMMAPPTNNPLPPAGYGTMHDVPMVQMANEEEWGLAKIAFLNEKK